MVNSFEYQNLMVSFGKILDTDPVEGTYTTYFKDTHDRPFYNTQHTDLKLDFFKMGVIKKEKSRYATIFAAIYAHHTTLSLETVFKQIFPNCNFPAADVDQDALHDAEYLFLAADPLTYIKYSTAYKQEHDVETLLKLMNKLQNGILFKTLYARYAFSDQAYRNLNAELVNAGYIK